MRRYDGIDLSFPFHLAESRRLRFEQDTLELHRGLRENRRPVEDHPQPLVAYQGREDIDLPCALQSPASREHPPGEAARNAPPTEPFSYPSKYMEKLIERVQRSQHGFLDIQKAADEVLAEFPAGESFRLAQGLFSSEIHQVRALATFILGSLSARSAESLAFLKQRVSRDDDWRVQEILAKAFDRYCSDIGYEQALPVIREWLADPSPNVRRAVTEGLRIWTGRP